MSTTVCHTGAIDVGLSEAVSAIGATSLCVSMPACSFGSLMGSIDKDVSRRAVLSQQRRTLAAQHSITFRASPARLVSLYRDCISSPVRYIVRITWSSETLCSSDSLLRDPRGMHRLHRAHRIAFDARNLHQPADRIAGHPQVVLHRNLRRVLHLPVRAAHRRNQSAGRHRARHAHLALASNLRSADRRILLVENPNRRRGQKESNDPIMIGVQSRSARKYARHRRHHSRGSVRRRRHHAPTRGILLVHRHRIYRHPVQRRQRIARLPRRFLSP